MVSSPTFRKPSRASKKANNVRGLLCEHVMQHPRALDGNDSIAAARNDEDASASRGIARRMF